ncbi:MAG: hypothetical protein JWO38_7124, partial [Gemmataceae bacterium]|nr:hypothetical protein [Gemmataceae bacterium]
GLISHPPSHLPPPPFSKTPRAICLVSRGFRLPKSATHRVWESQLDTGNALYTVGGLSLRLGVQEHVLRKLAHGGQIPHARAGRYHVFAESDVPTIREFCIAAGYLRRPAVA